MTTAIRRRRGTTTQHSTFTGLAGELTVDTTKNTVVVHDGSTAGGFALAKENNATLSGSVNFSGGTANGVLYLNGSKVVTSGTAFTFNGTNLKIGNPTYAPNTNLSGNLLQIKSSSGFSYLTMGNGDGADNNTYIGSASAITTFGTVTDAGATTELMRLTSTGLGIGTTSPSAKLHVVGGATIQSSSAYGFNLNAGTDTVNTVFGMVFATPSYNFAAIRGQRVGPQDAGQLLFYTAPNGDVPNLRATLDQSGNLGLGVTPSAWYTSYGTKAFQFAGSGSVYGLDVSSSDRRAGLMNNSFINSSGNYIYINTGHATQYEQNAGKHVWYNAASGTAGNAITFTQAMTLDSSGNLLVGTTSKTSGSYIETGIEVNSANWATLFKCSSSSAGGGTCSQMWRSSATGSFVQFSYGTSGSYGSQVGSIDTNGTTTSYNTSSDYRLKNTIAPMTGALAKVALLKPCTYKWNVDGSDGEGFIAHELAEVMPNAVTGEKDAVDEEGNPKYQGIDTSFLVATLTAAIQELKAEFDAYKASHP